MPSAHELKQVIPQNNHYFTINPEHTGSLQHLRDAQKNVQQQNHQEQPPN